MTKLDVNRLVLVTALILLVLIAAGSGYRLEIGPYGFTFERGNNANTDPSSLADTPALPSQPQSPGTL
ncbi:hypothetical protein [Mesorhizobium onobrychidis]|uniref:Uncharacterized protein n=1 Tax=Mesorhizobium onobrychidis TaxID=2775404 RepID=A0ABY5R2G9_9HYPH|nr:hypothetical protein [Mesorhizobium onobrychidis]UVC17081.1 hypothetical protein IHQ72_08130 [Mesorhizobium onobrychidis]